jgi:hypothetical protein
MKVKVSPTTSSVVFAERIVGSLVSASSLVSTRRASKVKESVFRG